jgi:ABC-2 type transport system permease protein
VISLLIDALPQSWQVHVDKWVPAVAGSQIWAVKPATGSPPMFAPWTGFAVFCGYAVIALIAGLILIRRRDA